MVEYLALINPHNPFRRILLNSQRFVLIFLATGTHILLLNLQLLENFRAYHFIYIYLVLLIFTLSKTLHLKITR